MLPKLSIVIPVYNVEKYIRVCLDSVVGQSLRDIEIVVVSDCSPDNSDSVILEYANRDSRIKYIRHEKNFGVGAARNTGIKNATAKWITFLDPDDYIALHCYEVMLERIENSSADMGYFGAVYFEDETNKTIMTMPFYPDNESHAVTANNINLISPTVWSKIYRLKDIIDNDVSFPERLKHEDDEFLFKYFSIVEPLMALDATPFYFYRKRESSIMSGVNSSRKDLPDLALNIYKFLLQKNIADKYRAALLERIDFYCGSLNSIDYQYREDFIKKMEYLLKIMNLSEFELDSKRFVTKILAKEGVYDQLAILLEKVDRLMEDKWYKFGQLSIGQKVKKTFSFFINMFRR